MSARLLFAFALGFSTVAQAQPSAAETKPSRSGEASMDKGTSSEAVSPSQKNEVPAFNPGAEKSADTISLDDWNRPDWMLVKPRVSLIELSGNFRVRGDMFKRLNFGLSYVSPSYSGDNNLGSDWENPRRYLPGEGRRVDFTGTNMRLRVEPTINVSDDIHIVSTIDMLDNLVLGSTPLTLPYILPSAGSRATPTSLLNGNQQPPRSDFNSVRDSIAIKRLYARITALNEQLELRVGRLPDHWGLGMFANNGDCLDCDYGTVVDRLALTFKIADHLITPMFDWISNGPLATPYYRYFGQPVDAVDWDDADQYSLRLAHLDAKEDISDKITQGEKVLNYGVWGAYRRQARDVSSNYYSETGYNSAGAVDIFAPAAVMQRRDASVFFVDGFLRLYIGEVEIAAEAVAIYGSMKDRVVDPNEEDVTKLMQLGAALEATWRLRGDYKGTELSLKAGGASGDDHAGFGALDRADTQRGALAGGKDLTLNNFQFSPDYHLDLLMFRRIIGTVTDALYLRPQVAYTFDNNVSGRLAAIYSQAVMKASTPGNSAPLGLEFDAELAYGISRDAQGSGLKGALLGGILFPFVGFKDLNVVDLDKQGGSFAWTVQARLYVTF